MSWTNEFEKLTYWLSIWCA